MYIYTYVYIIHIYTYMYVYTSYLLYIAFTLPPVPRKVDGLASSKQTKDESTTSSELEPLSSVNRRLHFRGAMLNR